MYLLLVNSRVTFRQLGESSSLPRAPLPLSQQQAGPCREAAAKWQCSLRHWGGFCFVIFKYLKTKISWNILKFHRLFMYVKMPFCMPKLTKPGFLLRTFCGIMTQPLCRMSLTFSTLPHFIWYTFSCTRRLSRVWDSIWKMLPLHTQAQHNSLEVKFTDSGNDSHCVKTKSYKYWTESYLQKNGHRFYFPLWKSGHTFPAPERGARKTCQARQQEKGGPEPQKAEALVPCTPHLQERAMTQPAPHHHQGPLTRL